MEMIISLIILAVSLYVLLKFAENDKDENE